MKLGPVTKLDKKTMSKKFDVTSCQNIVTSLSFFGFLVNLEHFAGRIPDTESAKVMFSVIVAFCFTKTENRTKKVYFLKLHMGVYLRAKFEVSRIMLTGFR